MESKCGIVVFVSQMQTKSAEFLDQLSFIFIFELRG